MWEEALKENLKQKQDAINLNSNLQDGWLGLDEKNGQYWINYAYSSISDLRKGCES